MSLRCLANEIPIVIASAHLCVTIARRIPIKPPMSVAIPKERPAKEACMPIAAAKR